MIFTLCLLACGCNVISVRLYVHLTTLMWPDRFFLFVIELGRSGPIQMP